MSPTWLISGLAVLVAGGAGYGIGSARTGVHVEEGVGCLSTHRQVSCELDDGWTIGFTPSLPWSDSHGYHEDGRPTCLPPTGIGEEGPLTLAWVPVEVDGVGWRHVVWVGC